MRSWLAVAAAVLCACGDDSPPATPDPPTCVPAPDLPEASPVPPDDWDATIATNIDELIERGRAIFRDDTFGNESRWGTTMHLHDAIRGEANGGVGPGLTARQALELGLRVDSQRLDRATADAIKTGTLDLDSVDTTLALLRANALIGLRGQFSGDHLVGIGVTCSLCHTTVDDKLAPGVGRRRDGWPNRDLDVGKLIALAPNLSPFEHGLDATRDQVLTVLRSWGPGRFDARLLLDGKAFRPDGRTAAVLIPASVAVPYWAAFVANVSLGGHGTFVDQRLADPAQFPLAQKNNLVEIRELGDVITPKLEALHFYQLAIPPPEPESGSFDREAAARGERVFKVTANCARCHVPPLYSEPGWPMHTGAEIGIDDFQADRSPERRYRTTPLRGLAARMKGGFYHDGRFPDLDAVIDHYEEVFGFRLEREEQQDLVEYLKSL